MSLLTKLFGNYSEKEIKRILPLQKKVLELEEEYRALSDEELKAKTEEFKYRPIRSRRPYLPHQGPGVLPSGGSDGRGQGTGAEVP